MAKLSKPPKEIKVRVVKLTRGVAWYHVGEEHTVLNQVVFGYIGGPAFEVSLHSKGINICDCEVIGAAPAKYTMKQLRKIVGHDFEISK